VEEGEGNMKYMGSKNRIAKYILPIIEKIGGTDLPYVEPFVGGANIIDKIKNINKTGYDKDKNVVDALIQIRDHVNELPRCNKEFTEADYKKLKTGNYKFKAYAGYAFSYGGKWMGGWRRDSVGKRDYVAEAYRNAVKQSKNIQDVMFRVSDFTNIVFPQKTLIYCDPPYFGTTKYKGIFNHIAFWNWCKSLKTQGHIVLVSEYSAPDDVKCLWSKEITSSLTKNTGSKKGIEKLFMV
jgi:DNA adenine methylase